MSVDNNEPVLLPHHEQQALCETRLPYRQGRKLTAVKVYSINNESRHFLVFGVPSLNLRQEAKALFSKFGKLQFNLTKYPSEMFTETYHAAFYDIQAARLAKKMLDTKNFYGGNLHICYAPEFETISDTREKLLLRQRNVIARLKNLQKDTKNQVSTEKIEDKVEISVPTVSNDKLYMGNVNKIGTGKRKVTDFNSVKHCKFKKSRNFDRKMCVAVVESEKPTKMVENVKPLESVCEVVDFTSTDKEVLTNINESLNYDRFGTEVVKQVPTKPVNKIKFNVNKK
uniref:RNA-binding protein 48 n=1 Tax=Heliothis virescens TaxID=7102 RepID=A0A2A4K6K3_HELVI